MVIKGVPCKSTLLIICILFYKETMFQCELLWYDNFHRFFHIHNKQRKLKQPQQLWYISLFYVQCCKNSLQNFLRVCNHPVKWHTITSFNGQIHVWPVVLQLECFGVGSLTYFIALTTATAMLSHFSRVRLCVTPETAAHQAPPSLGFSRQEHWSGLPFPSPMHESEKWKWNHSVVSDPQRSHGLQPSRLLHPWDFPSKSTGVGCHCLLHLDPHPST